MIVVALYERKNLLIIYKLQSIKDVGTAKELSQNSGLK